MFKRETAVKLQDEGLQTWYNRVDDLITWLAEKNAWNGWKSWRASYELDRLIHWAEKKGEDQNISSDSEDLNKITVPLVASHIRNLVPFLYIKDPVFYGRPFNEKDFQSMQAQMDYLNYAWREFKMGKQVKRAILDAAIIGHGIVKTGWTLELNEVKNTGKGVISYYDYIKKEAPWTRRINPFLFLFDRFAPEFDLDSARWCCELIITPLQDIVDDERYDPELRNKLYNGKVIPTTVEELRKKASPDDQNNFLFAPKNKKNNEDHEYDPTTLALIYEIWDKKFDQVITLLATDDENSREHALRIQENPYPYLDNFPFEKVDFEEVPNDPYGIGHARYLVDVQKQINRNRNKMYAITRQFNPKWVYSGQEPMDQVEKQKVKDDIPGDVITLKPNCILTPLELPKISVDLYNIGQILDKDFSELSGDDILARGGLLPSRTSAEEIRERSKLRGLRLETNVQNTYDFTLNIGKKIIQHARRYLKSDIAFNVIGRPGIIAGNTITPSDMATTFGIEMSVISKTLDPPEVRRQAFAQMFQLFTNPNMIQMMQQMGVPINFGALVYKYLETLDVNEVEAMFPGYSGFKQGQIPQDMVPINTGNPASPNQPATPESTRNIQSDNVSPNSEMQGMEGMFNLEQ